MENNIACNLSTTLKYFLISVSFVSSIAFLPSPRDSYISCNFTHKSLEVFQSFYFDNYKE